MQMAGMHFPNQLSTTSTTTQIFHPIVMVSTSCNSLPIQNTTLCRVRKALAFGADSACHGPRPREDPRPAASPPAVGDTGQRAAAATQRSAAACGACLVPSALLHGERSPGRLCLWPSAPERPKAITMGNFGICSEVFRISISLFLTYYVITVSDTWKVHSTCLPPFLFVQHVCTPFETHQSNEPPFF